MKVVFSILLIAIIGTYGFAIGFRVGTGEYPTLAMLKAQPAVVLPVIPEARDLATIKVFLGNDTTDEMDYDVNEYNCLDYAWTVMRRMTLDGIDARIARVSFVDGDDKHAILLIPTTDKGWILVEPMADEVLNIKIGRFYLNGIGWRVIKAIDVLDYNWVDIETYTGIQGVFK
jgi:hypothetical protein